MSLVEDKGLPTSEDSARGSWGFTVREVSEHYGVHEQTVRRWIKLDQVPTVKYGRFKLIPRAFIEKYGLPDSPPVENMQDQVNEAMSQWESRWLSGGRGALTEAS